jgi:hypothetical protein
MKEKTDAVKPVYKGHWREPENVLFMSCCSLYTGSNYVLPRNYLFLVINIYENFLVELFFLDE